MNRAIKIIVIAIAILGLAVGGALGASSGASAAESMEDFQIMQAQAALSDFAATQIQHSDADHARSALLLEIRFIEDLQRLQPTSAAGVGLWIPYTRLGMVEESAGQTTAAHAAFDQARIWMRKSSRTSPPHPDMSDGELKDALQSWEKQWELAMHRMAERKPIH